jgi:uncharacterized protein
MALSDFDRISIARPKLAASYIEMLLSQPGRPLALFGSRRIGKTYFLLNDLAPVATARDFVVIYADLWLQKLTPVNAINYALQNALDELSIPQTAAAKAAKTPIKKVGLFGAALDFGDPPAERELSTDPQLALDSLIVRLHKKAKKPILLLIDEVQQLGEVANGADAIGALRAILTSRRAIVSAVFTGSSQEGLAAMMVASGAPMYQFAQLLDFPSLGVEFLKPLARHFSRVHPQKQLDIESLSTVFAHLGYKPALMKDIVKEMSAEGDTDVKRTLKRMMSDEKLIAGWRALLEPLQPIDRSLLHAVATGAAPFGKDVLKSLGVYLGKPVTLAQARASMARLQREKIVSKRSAGEYVLEDQLLADYILQNTPVKKL